MLLKKISLILSFFMIFLAGITTYAATPNISWKDWLAQLRTEAISKGIRPALFDDVFKNINGPSRSVLAYDRNQPEKRITFLKYRNTRADSYRILIGKRKLKKNLPLLSEIGSKYGVSPCVITSLWGLETSYGSFMGKFPVIQSLSTLAYDTRRSDFFRMQLLYALEILNGGHVDAAHFKGEWAGASGHPQFLPSSWHKYAVDYDGDGRKDIWTSYPDVFASIANYLAKNGWQANQPWAIYVKDTGRANDLINAKKQLTVNEWRKLGLKTLSGHAWPTDGSLKADLIRPDGGPDILVFNNFRVIMKWNRSTYYAGTVGYLAEKICSNSGTH